MRLLVDTPGFLWLGPHLLLQLAQLDVDEAITLQTTINNMKTCTLHIDKVTLLDVERVISEIDRSLHNT